MYVYVLSVYNVHTNVHRFVLAHENRHATTDMFVRDSYICTH